MRRWVGVSEDLKNADGFGVPYGSRTRVAAVKGRCPRPLDERDNYKQAAGGLLQVVKLTYVFRYCQTRGLLGTDAV